jgi:hypothetical protein
MDMKRIRLAGLCLVAGFAFSAVVGASVAQAAEYGQCVAKKKGKYAEAKCETLDEKKGKPKGKFEKAPGPGYTSTSGTATLAIAVCAASTDVGEVKG